MSATLNLVLRAIAFVVLAALWCVIAFAPAFGHWVALIVLAFTAEALFRAWESLAKRKRETYLANAKVSEMERWIRTMGQGRATNEAHRAVRRNGLFLPPHAAPARRREPRLVTRGRRVLLAWFSPDCRHFSRAKGAAPVSARVRHLPWTVIRWARDVAPRIIMMENVAEILTWGPLGPDGRPDKKQSGRTFKLWVRKLRSLGYAVEWRELRAHDYGAATTRKRLFLVARNDGLPIVWPEPTHGPGKLPYKTARDILDFDLPCPSIFGRKKPLALKTQLLFRAQGFPEDYEIAPVLDGKPLSIQAQQKLVGNSVARAPACALVRSNIRSIVPELLAGRTKAASRRRAA